MIVDRVVTTFRRIITPLSITVAAFGFGLATAAPASAGGVGDFLSPAFGTSCANQHTGARANGTTTHGTGAADGNLAGLPVGSPLNQCGGADLPPLRPDAGGRYGDNAVGALVPGGESILKPMLGPFIAGKPEALGGFAQNSKALVATVSSSYEGI
ncbi:chaplin family protein [Streptomyces sp. NPDC003036]|uniref:chaplin family protein n=1 Tax=Streptomyces sp. NPDC003036 TaxID=3154442 RepID=UPI0033A4B8FB